MNENIQFGEFLQNKRLLYGVSQNKLAVISGVPRQYISDVETGKILPDKDKQKYILIHLVYIFAYLYQLIYFLILHH